MVRKRDRFWEHAEDLNGKFKCKFCDKIFPGGVPRVKSHLSGIKGGGIDICTKVPDHVRVAVAEVISSPNKRAKVEACSGKTEETSPKMPISKDDDMLEKLLTKFILLNDLNVDIVQRPSFINLLNGVAKHGSPYKLPYYSMVKEKLVPDLEKEIGEYVGKVKKSWDATGCTIISDIWYDKERCFVNIFAHSIEGMVLLNALDTRKDKLTSSLVREFICFVTHEIGANNIVQYITKDNKTEGLYEHMPNYGHVYETYCIAHEIHLLFEEINSKIKCVQTVFDQARAVFTKIHKHDGIANNFYSNYKMLRSIMGAASEPQSLVPSSEWLSLCGINCNSEFWSEGKEVLYALELIVRVLHLVDSYSATSGVLYEAVKMADEAIEKLCETNERKYQDLRKTFKQWRKKVIHPMHAAAAFLNPLYMWSDKFIDNGEMKQGMDFMLKKLVGAEDRKKFTEETKLYRYKVPELFNFTAMTMLQTSHPCDWWNYCGDVLPVLKKYAIRILSQPCSTSSRRRSLSAFEIAQIEKRKPPVPAVMDNYLYLRTNALLMENFNAMREIIGKPLDLEKLHELPEGTEFINGNFTSDLLNETKVPLSDGKLNCRSASMRKDGERNLLLHFITKLPPILNKATEVKGETRASIHVILVDSNTGCVVRSGPLSVLKLTVTVIEGDFDEEAGKNWTREFFKSKEIMEREGKMPLLNGDLSMILDKGMGTLSDDITFNDVSSWTSKGTFRLGVKTESGCCEGIRVLEGTSNAFTVKDVEMANPNSLRDMSWTTEANDMSRVPCRETDNAPVGVGGNLSLTMPTEPPGTSLVEPRTSPLGQHYQIGNASGYCEGIHVLEGTSNAFEVEDVGMANDMSKVPCRETDNALGVGDNLSLTMSAGPPGTSLVEPRTLLLEPHCQIGNASAGVSRSSGDVQESASSRENNEFQFLDDTSYDFGGGLNFWNFTDPPN